MKKQLITVLGLACLLPFSFLHSCAGESSKTANLRTDKQGLDDHPCSGLTEGAALGCAPPNEPSPAPSVAADANPEFQLGLPHYCKSTQDKDQFCMTCTRFDFPAHKCFAVEDKFVPSQDCHYVAHDKNSDEVTCLNLKAPNKNIKIVLGKTKLDSTIENLPIIILGSKLFFQEKLKAKPVERQLLADVLDFLNANIKDVLLGKSQQEAARDLRTLFRKYDSRITDSEGAAIEQGAIAAFKSASDRIATGADLSLGGVMDVAHKLVELLPEGKGRDLAQYLDMAKILSTLASLKDNNEAGNFVQILQGLSP